MKIAIDIDDTLTEIDRIAATEKYLSENGFSFRLVDPYAHALSAMYDWTHNDVTRFIKSGGYKVFTDAPLRKGAKETLRKWRAAGHEIVILTARPSAWFDDAESVSKAQMDRCGVPCDRVVADVWEKGEYCRAHGIEILIEDNFEICKKAQALGVKAVLFVDRHNLEHAKEIRYAGSDWGHIASAVEYILDPPRERS